MSKTIYKFVKCEKCEQNFETEIYMSVNTELENATEKTRSGEYMMFKCPHCGHVSFILHSFLYNDMNDNFMIQYASDEEDVYGFIHASEDLDEKFPNILRNQTRRIIIGPYPLFVEKLEILKSHLNDKIVELYKYYLSTALTDKNYLHIEFEASKDYTQYRFNVIYKDKTEHFGFSRDFYKELEEKFLDEPYVTRTNDYIVDQRYVQSILKKGYEAEPVHVELFFTKREYCVKIKFDGRTPLWYKTEFEIGINTKVEVPYSKYKLTGYVVDEKFMSEKELGFSFDKLRTVEKVYYSVDDITNKLNNGLFDQLFSGATVYNADLDLSSQELNMFVEGETIHYDNEYMMAATKLSKLEKNTRIAIISTNPDRIDEFANASENMFHVAVFNKQYFKVLKIYEYNGKNFIILLHLPKEHWHILSANIELRITNNDIVDLAIERLNTKSFIDGPVLTQHPQWESLCDLFNLTREGSKKVISPLEVI